MTEKKRLQGIADALKDAGKNFSRPYYKRHHDDEFCDEIRIKVVPRFKTSGMSGDEWRTSVRIELLRKGEVFASTSSSKMQFALLLLGSFYLKAHEPVPEAMIERDKKKCDQPGCSEDAVNHYKKKLEKHGSSGHTSPVSKDRETRCKFCARHSERGDSDLEDNDENLVLVKGDGEVSRNLNDESPARQVVAVTDRIPTTALDVACPDCMARPQAVCVPLRGPRHYHPERKIAALETECAWLRTELAKAETDGIAQGRMEREREIVAWLRDLKVPKTHIELANLLTQGLPVAQTVASTCPYCKGKNTYCANCANELP